MTTPPPRERRDISFSSGDSHCCGWLYLPAGDAPAPVVVLGHGLGATREMRLDAYCERFAAAGIAALAFTYRNFGDSGGEPRQLISIDQQLTDWESAIKYARSLPELDARRVAIWGTSFGGGHVISVAARHPELKAAVAQCPFTDGFATAMTVSPKATLKLLPYVARDVVAKLTGRLPVMVPIAAEPGRTGLMNAPDALPGYAALMPEGAAFVNQTAARVIPQISRYRPGKQARKINFPILFCVSSTDTVAPAKAAIRHAARAPYGETKLYPAGHFAFYLGDAFEELVTDQTAFLTENLLTPALNI